MPRDPHAHNAKTRSTTTTAKMKQHLSCIYNNTIKEKDKKEEKKKRKKKKEQLSRTTSKNGLYQNILNIKYISICFYMFSYTNTATISKATIGETSAEGRD